MKGVEYYFDREGEPKAVLIDLKMHGDLWEDFQDLLVVRERRNQPTVSLAEVVKTLKKRKKPSKAR